MPVSKVLLVGGATRMPCIGRFLKRLTGLTVRPVVDPEEAVALGAAVSAGILSGAIDQKVSNPHLRILTYCGAKVCSPSLLWLLLLTMKVYNPFFDEKMAPTKKSTGGRKSSKPTKKKEAAPLSAEVVAAAAAVRQAASAERSAAGAEALEARLREENARLVAQLDATPEDLEDFSP